MNGSDITYTGLIANSLGDKKKEPSVMKNIIEKESNN